LVAKVHKEGQRYSAQKFDVVLIGHEGHPEVEGTMGRIPGKVYLVSSIDDVDQLQVKDPDKLAYVTQTTLSVDDTRDVIDALKQRFPKIVGPDVKDICYATQNRQSAVRKLAEEVDVLLVVGAQNSSNSNRLREIGAELNVPSYLIDDAQALDADWLKDAETVGITAGASAPEALVQELIARLSELGDVEFVDFNGIQENVSFKLPADLQGVAA
jgi:4-hydroxy-3-methylbut-2-enyl diphosphate reductase